MYKLKVNRNECIACGMCALECKILQEDSSGKVEVVGEGIVSDSEVGKVRNIASLCPTNALTLTEEFVNAAAKLTELKEKMQQPLTFTPPSADEYDFRLEDKDEYAEAITGSLSVSGEYEYDYSSSSSAESAGKAAFRDEIYSQAEALAQQVIVMYEQRRLNKVARYAETNGNYKYGVHQRLIKDLRSFVNESESYTGKKISLPSDFFTFRTRDTEYINERQDHSNDWLAGRIKEHLKPASEFYTCVRTDRTYEYVTVSHWFGEDTREKKYSYAYYIKPDSVARFYRDVARATWKAGKYTKQFCERELERFHKEIAQEWNEKISYLLRQLGDDDIKKNFLVNEHRELLREEKTVQKSSPIHELKSILINSYPNDTVFVNHKDKDYGDLWHISHNGYEFVDERFERNRTSVDRNWHQINDREKAFALELICQGRYSESDCIRIGVIRKEKSSLGGQSEADRFLGFALTKDSFCMKGLWLADCIIPYGNIKEVTDNDVFNSKEIVFFISKDEMGYITLSSGQYGFDSCTREQLQKYLNTVKNKYSPAYDKIFLKSSSMWSETPWLKNGSLWG